LGFPTDDLLVWILDCSWVRYQLIVGIGSFPLHYYRLLICDVCYFVAVIVGALVVPVVGV